jgi:uncharacterized RDD family membrane protein YckC
VKRRRLVHSPEHVLIELTPAGLGTRFAAFLLDAALILGATGVLSQIGQLLPGAIRGLFVATTGFVVIWGYNVLFEVLWNGQTPGKRALRIRVVDGRGLPVDGSQSLIRNVVRLLDVIPFGGIGMLAALLDPEHRRLGDRAADTLVVSEDQPVTPRIETFGALRFNSLRTARVRRLIDHRLGVEERELLYALCLRAPHLSERARYELFEEVGEHYRVRLAVEDPHLSGENLVRAVASLCSGTERASTEPGRNW